MNCCVLKNVISICLVSFLICSTGLAADITVTNSSFELPYVGPGGAAFGIDSWGVNGPAAGVAGNGWSGGQIDLLNSDGVQIAWMNTYADTANDLASSGIWQVLSDTYEIGQTYELTAGFARGYWNQPSDNDQIQLRLWYDNNGAPETIVSVTATASELNWSNGNYLIDYSVTLPAVQVSDAWAGKAIGIWIISSYEDPAGDGGDWVVDNVRLSIPDIATNPSPFDGKDLVAVDTDLTWEPPYSYSPIGYNVYLGTDPNVDNASVMGWTETSISPEQDMGYALEKGKKYYWRVDSLQDGTPEPVVFEGKLWSFIVTPPNPLMIEGPASVTVPAGTAVELKVTALNIDTYTWYFSTDNVADESDVNLGATVVPSIQVNIDDVSDEGWYYCVGSNTIGTDTSALARIMTERLVGYWDFEGDLADSVPGGASMHNGVIDDPNFTSGVPEIGGQAYKFFGDSRVVTVTDSIDYFNFYTQGLTITCWVKGQNPGIWDTVCSKAYERELGYTVAKGFYLGRSVSGEGAFAIRPTEILSTGANISVDSWHMLTAVHDPADAVVRIYVDGELRNEHAANPASFNSPNLAPLVFGAESTDGTIGSSTASLDELKIYSYALDSTVIAQQYVDVMGGYICVGGNPTADLTGDCQVNIEDFAMLAVNWLSNNRIE